MLSVSKSLSALENYCVTRNFKGWDPYDGLNAKLFKLTPFKYWPYARLAWIQLFKRSPVNLRKIVIVPEGYNPKGLALFISGYCQLYKLNQEENYLNRIIYLSNKLIELQSKGFSGACWGYNFDWQARGGLYFPSGTPTVVVTCFCAVALFEAYEVTQNESYLKTALSSANFIIHDLNRTKKAKGFLFSYSPYKGNDTVYNASLMGSKLLSFCYHYTRNKEFADLAHESIVACIESQQKDGSWLYGELPIQNWIDSFHTGYNLECLQAYQDLCDDKQYNKNIKSGLKFYINNFFLDNGIPKYYNNGTFPIDIHCPAQLFVTLSKLNCFKEYKNIAKNVMLWTIKNLQDNRGYFYYQKHKQYSIKIPYMRWSQAFMFYGMSHYKRQKMK